LSRPAARVPNQTLGRGNLLPNKRHWITVTLDDSLPDELVLGLLEDSYALVVDGLSKRERDLVRSHAP
jgi:predicted DNA-binding protein (MmcQ/YjbR family)